MRWQGRGAAPGLLGCLKRGRGRRPARGPSVPPSWRRHHSGDGRLAASAAEPRGGAGERGPGPEGVLQAISAPAQGGERGRPRDACTGAQGWRPGPRCWPRQAAHVGTAFPGLHSVAVAPEEGAQSLTCPGLSGPRLRAVPSQASASSLCSPVPSLAWGRPERGEAWRGAQTGTCPPLSAQLPPCLPIPSLQVSEEVSQELTDSGESGVRQLGPEDSHPLPHLPCPRPTVTNQGFLCPSPGTGLHLPETHLPPGVRL